MREQFAAGVAGLAALTASLALGLQLALTVGAMTADGASVAAATWRFLGFFTILTNLAVAVVGLAMARRSGSRLARPRVRLATAAAIALVGIVYSVALRAAWAPSGWQAVADHALHDATPPLFLLAWALSAHGALRWRDAAWAGAAPVAYFAYALSRAQVDGWYAYWFLDPATLGPARFTANAALLLAAFLAAGVLLVAADRFLGRREKRRRPALDESGRAL